MDPKIETLLERCKTLPTLPTVAFKLVQLCQRDDVGMADLVAVVATDPALSAKLLKLVNSAAFGQRQEVRTLSHAVMLVGTNALRALALSFSLLPAIPHRQRYALEAFWKRAVVSAIAARELATIVARPLAEEAFLCGLLQDLGMLGLTQALGTQYHDLLARAGDDNEALAALEHETLGTDHAEVGAWLLGRWQIPEVIRTAVEASHAPGRVDARTPPDTATLIRVTAAAGLLADIWVRPDVPGATDRAKVRLLGLFELSEDQLRTLLPRIAGAMPEIAPLFDITLGAPEEIARVLEAAKDTLVVLSLKASARIEAAQRTIQALEDRTETLEREAQRDPLTGLYNRRALERCLEKEFSLSFHGGVPLTVILGDVDRFKTVNDEYGHPVGDQVLREIATGLCADIRPRDLVGRYGGEEFLVVLPATTPSGARVVAERMRAKIEASDVRIDGGPVVRVTMSFGHATARHGRFTCWAELVRAADDALYEAKRAGRNRVIADGDGPTAAADVPAPEPHAG